MFAELGALPKANENSQGLIKMDIFLIKAKPPTATEDDNLQSQLECLQ